MEKVFGDSGLLGLVQEFTPTHRLAATCKVIKAARKEYPLNIEYKLTLTATQKYLRDPKFRDELHRRIRPSQLVLRCEEDGNSDDEHGYLGDRRSGSLTRQMYTEIVKKVKGFEIIIDSKCLVPCLEFIDDWGKVFVFDAPLLFFDLYGINWKAAEQLTEVGVFLESEEFLDDMQAVKSLRFYTLVTEARKEMRQNLVTLETLVISSREALIFENFAYMPRLLILSVGFYDGPRPQCRSEVVKHLKACCPNLIKLNLVLIYSEDLKGLADLKMLRSLAIPAHLIPALPNLPFLTKLSVHDSASEYVTDPAIVKPRTLHVIQALVNKRSDLAALEELVLECAYVDDFEFLKYFPLLKHLKIIPQCYRTIYPGFYPERGLQFELAGNFGNVALWKPDGESRESGRYDIEDF